MTRDVFAGIVLKCKCHPSGNPPSEKGRMDDRRIVITNFKSLGILMIDIDRCILHTISRRWCHGKMCSYIRGSRPIQKGSWLNMVEIEISALSRQCLDRRIGDIKNLSNEVSA